MSRTSVVKRLSDLRSFFRWLLDHEDADTRAANPFDGVQPAKSIRGKQAARRPWSTEELSTFLHGVSSDDPLWSLGAIGAYSGARLEEIAGLRVDAVEGESFVVEEGKRQASVRRIPIHPVVAPLFARLVETSPDGYLIPYLLTSGYDGKRGGLASKRLGNTLRRMGITDRRVVFHSLRNTVETQMIARGVPLERAQMIVGHVSLGSSLPYVDRGSVQDVANREALSLVSYGQELDSFVRETGAGVTVRKVSKARKQRD
jgi:integrase